MPEDFRIFSIIGFVAQEMLIPQRLNYSQLNEACKFILLKLIIFPNNSSLFIYFIAPGISMEKVKSITTVQGFKTNLHDYYTERTLQSGFRSLQSYSHIFLKSMVSAPDPKSIKLRTVDEYSNRRDGIYFPNNLSPTMVWKHGINPFTIESCQKLIAEEFCPVVYRNPTADLKMTNQLLSRYLFTHPESTTAYRGNEAISSQDRKPDWMSKAHYLSFGIIRSYPFISYDELCVALYKNDLLLDREEFHILIRLVFYHVGPVDGETLTRRLRWQTSSVFSSCTFDRIETVISKLVDIIKGKPRLKQSLFILGEISDYLSQWSDQSILISRNISRIFSDWADSIEASLLHDSEIVSVNRKQQCIFYTQSILSHKFRKLTQEDSVHICKMNVLATAVRFFDDNSHLTNEMRKLTIQTHSVMSHQFDTIQPYLLSGVLTEICKSVLVCTPLSLSWNQVDKNTGCYDAVLNSDDGSTSLYSMNIITGVVLLNGKAKGKLEKSITSHPLYIKTFGDRNFEVSISSNGVAETIRPLGKYYYSFHFDMRTNYLTIVERLPNGFGLELLVSSPISNLPKWLCETCSHWICRKRNVVIFRGISIENRAVKYIMCRRASLEKCVLVPVHLQNRDFDELFYLLSSNDQNKVIMNQCLKVINTLSKFDHKDYIITMINESSGYIIFSLPRYKLQFELRSCGILYSLDFAGFTLDINQQYNDMLHLFSNYLTISRGALETKVLICYFRDFNVDSNGFITDKNPTYEYYIYDLDQRQNLLKANCIPSRLYLALLHVVTSRDLPDVRYCMTGAAYAQSLLRECWRNTPLSSIDVSVLQLIIKFANGYPGLILICNNLHLIASQLCVLHNCIVDKLTISPDYIIDSRTHYTNREYNKIYRKSLNKYEYFKYLIKKLFPP